MTDVTPEAADVEETQERPRLLAIEVGGWPGLKTPVRLELDPRVTVLVGKNAAGKSLLMEAFYWALNQVAKWTDSTREKDDIPLSFACEISLPAQGEVRYECQIGGDDPSSEEQAPSLGSDPWALLRERLKRWSERGLRLRDGAEIWRSAGPTLVTASGRTEIVARGIFSLLGGRKDPELGALLGALKDLLNDTSIVRPGTLQREMESAGTRTGRRSVMLYQHKDRSRKAWSWTSTTVSEVDELGAAIANAWQHDRPAFDALADILRDLDLVQHVSINLYKSVSPENNDPPSSGDLAAVLFDGVNIGFCSDGTLRTARIAMELVRPSSSCLLIEEPETAVHPGLLDKMLGVIEAYSMDRQIILSTHSPEVVDWFAPRQIRLVERERGFTRVHALSAEDRELALSYLDDQGALSDFIFRRSVG